MKKANRILIILLSVMTAYSFTITYWHFGHSPIPFPDRGHRYYSVTDQKAAVALVTIFQREAGIGEQMTFSPPPVNHQMLLTDWTTVLGWDDSVNNALPANGISLPVKNPEESAERTVATLRKLGYKAELVPLLPGMNDKIMGVKTNAFRDAFIAYRLNIADMGDTPNEQHLTKK